MSLKTIFNEICEKLGNIKSVTKKFDDLKTDEERFRVVYDFCYKYMSNFNFEIITKCSEKSVKVRKAGNEHFGKKNYWDALKLYNESVALAPNASEELAVALGNRAACLLKLEFPKEALDDVEKALKLSVANDFIKKLLERKSKCLELVNKNFNELSFGSGDLVSLSKKQSSYFDSASESVGLLHDEYFERQLVANEDIKTGEILVVEVPYSSVLLPDHFYTHCTYCFKRSLSLMPCSSCSTAMYCSEECRTSSISKFHKVECNILDILVKLRAERMELLSLRILIEATQQGTDLEKLPTKVLNPEVDKEYKSLDFINIYNLVTNSDKRAASDLFYRSVIAVILIYLLEKYTKFFDVADKEKYNLKNFSGGLILKFMQSLPCNAHEISEFCDDGLNEIGAGVYATLSLINHSCDPNVVRYSYKDVVVLRAIRPIKKGEQILDNYGYHYATHTFKERQNALIKQYYFKCQCEACTQLWPKYEDLPEEKVLPRKEMNMKLYQELTDEFEVILDSILQGKMNGEILEKNMRYLDFLDEFVKRPWKTYNKCQEAIKFCMSFYGNHFRFSKKVLPE